MNEYIAEHLTDLDLELWFERYEHFSTAYQIRTVTVNADFRPTFNICTDLITKVRNKFDPSN